MKVKCIDNQNGLNYLTIRKIYDVIDDNAYCYKIINDRNNERYYPKEFFRILSEIRNKKIDKLLE